MKQIIFDTSVWIDFLNGVNNAESLLLEKYISLDEPVFLCPTILMEILQGIKNEEQFQKTKRILLSFPMLDLPSLEAAIGAVNIYRELRKEGITIRKSNDCLIAFFAIHFKITLVHRDKDFNKIASNFNLKTK